MGAGHLAILAAALLLHLALGIGFTTASVLLLPVVALVWLAALGRSREVGAAIAGLTGLRNEETIFLAASVLGTLLSVLMQRTPFPEVLASGVLPAIPF